MDIKISERLYELRKKSGFSQEELSERIGVSRQAISKWERGESFPDTENLILLSKLYNVSVDHLLCLDTKDAKDINENAEILSDDTIKPNSDGETKNVFQKFPYPIAAAVIYLIMGFCFSFWHSGWIIFMTIPIYYDIVNALSKKPYKSIALTVLSALPYPLIAAIIYILLGFEGGFWHPGWLIFITIPIYYFIVNQITKNKN